MKKQRPYMKSMVFSIVILCSTEGAQNFREEKSGHLQTISCYNPDDYIHRHRRHPSPPP